MSILHGYVFHSWCLMELMSGDILTLCYLYGSEFRFFGILVLNILACTQSPGRLVNPQLLSSLPRFCGCGVRPQICTSSKLPGLWPPPFFLAHFENCRLNNKKALDTVLLLLAKRNGYFRVSDWSFSICSIPGFSSIDCWFLTMHFLAFSCIS